MKYIYIYIYNIYIYILVTALLGYTAELQNVFVNNKQGGRGYYPFTSL